MLTVAANRPARPDGPNPGAKPDCVRALARCRKIKWRWLGPAVFWASLCS
jgi:hypothetical protein